MCYSLNQNLQQKINKKIQSCLTAQSTSSIAYGWVLSCFIFIITHPHSIIHNSINYSLNNRQGGYSMLWSTILIYILIFFYYFIYTLVQGINEFYDNLFTLYDFYISFIHVEFYYIFIKKNIYENNLIYGKDDQQTVSPSLKLLFLIIACL